MLELIDLTIIRGGETLVDGLDLTLGTGRVFWVVGPNGTGKSSFLRVLAGLDRPDRGSVRRRLPADERLLYFHSETGIPGAATVADWDRLARRLLPDGTVDGAAVGRAAGLWPPVPGRRSVRRLSTGERKRLLLDVLLRQSGGLLLDEPFEHLSPDAKQTLLERLVARARRHLVVVATNQATERAALDGGLRLEAGEAVPLGGAGAVERAPPGSAR